MDLCRVNSRCIAVPFLVFACLVGACAAALAVESPEARSARIHEEVLTVDTHVDTPLRMLDGSFDVGERHTSGRRSGRVDLPRMKEGGLDAIFFAVYMGQGPRTAEGHQRAKERALSRATLPSQPCGLLI